MGAAAFKESLHGAGRTILLPGSDCDSHGCVLLFADSMRCGFPSGVTAKIILYDHDLIRFALSTPFAKSVLEPKCGRSTIKPARREWFSKAGC